MSVAPERATRWTTVEEPRDGDQPDEPGERPGNRPPKPTSSRRRPTADAAAGHDLDDDREDDEADDVVGDCRAEDDTSLGRRQRPQIAEDAGRDPDARRGEGRAKEDRDVGRLPECAATPAPRANGTATPMMATSMAVRPTRPSSARSISMPTWTSSRSTPISAITARLTPRSPVTLDEPQHRRSDDDAGDDLAEHSRDADALRQLGRQLRGGEDDQQVEQQARQIDDRRGGEHGSGADARLEVGGQRVASSASIQPRRRTVTMSSGRAPGGCRRAAHRSGEG